ncbi:MAG: SCO family protein, partial [Nitrospirota bacterium]
MMLKVFVFLILLFSLTFSCSREEKQIGVLDIAGNVVRKDGEPAAGFTLTDQNGKKVSLKDFQGKLVLINFIYSNCKGTCPPLLLKFKEIQLDLKDEFKKQTVLLSVSFDYERDTPEVLKKFAESQRADLSFWTFLTGSQAEIEKMLNDYQVAVKKGPDGEFGHINMVVMIDKDGKRRYDFFGYDYPTEKIIERIHEV